MEKDYLKYLREKIARRDRTIDVLSSVVKEAEKSAGEMREKYLSEKTRRMETERALHESKMEVIRLNLENQELRGQFIDQRKLQDALAEGNGKIKKLEKELNRRSGLEDPYGLATPSSKKVNKPNSTPENMAKRGGANKSAEGSSPAYFQVPSVDNRIRIWQFQEFQRL